MFRFALAGLVLLLLASPTVAQPGPVWFQVNMSCTLLANFARCEIWNHSSQPMFCNLRADGTLANGYVLYSYMGDWVQPHDWRHVYVYTAPPPSPQLVGVVGGGQCRY